MPVFQEPTLDRLVQPTTARGACVLAGPFYSILDHTIPICSILDIPMITKSPNIVFNFKRFYPPFKCEFKDWSLPYVIERFSTIFYGFNVSQYTFRELIELSKREKPNDPLWKLPVKFIYHLHGCSDKRWFKSQGHLLDVDQILLYGNRMKDIFSEMGLLKKMNSYGMVGNYRYCYYKKHKAFFDRITDKEIFSKFKKDQFTLLYAPTWKDDKNSSSIFDAYRHVIENLPKDFNLLIKLHPNLSLPNDHYDPKSLYSLLDRYSKHSNIQLIPLFPCVYPILNRVDAYLGDLSSIGYDALTFNLPMFFLNHQRLDPKKNPLAYLLQCGISILPKDFKHIYSIIDKNLKTDHERFTEIRQKTYAYAFGKDLSFSATKKRLQSFLL